MVLSDNYPASVASLVERASRLVSSLSRYDLLLAVIPTAFVFAAVLGVALPVPPRDAVLAASVVGVAALVDALFLNPPRRPVGP